MRVAIPISVEKKVERVGTRWDLFAILLTFGLIIHRISAPLFLLGLASAVICLWCAAGSEFTPTPPLPTPQTRQPLQRDRDASGSAFLNDSPPPPQA